jgi:hypothetical protein
MTRRPVSIGRRLEAIADHVRLLALAEVRDVVEALQRTAEATADRDPLAAALREALAEVLFEYYENEAVAEEDRRNCGG